MSWLLFIIGAILWFIVGYKVTPALLHAQVSFNPQLIFLSFMWLVLTGAAIACFWFGFVNMGKEELGVGDD